MVKGETYYAKFQTTPSVDLTGYSGRYELELQGGRIITQGTLTKGNDYFELTLQTDTMDLGSYELVCFVTFPDGFVQLINRELIVIE